MLNVFLSTCINSEEAKEKWITSRTNNETFNAKLELENLAQNGTIDGGTKQNWFGIFNSRGEKYARKFRVRSNPKSARPKLLLRREWQSQQNSWKEKKY